MPSGVALQSVYGDQTYALPSWLDNAGFDILQDFSPLLRPDYPSCPIWPTVPPRADPYCEASMLCHPLVSPTIASNWSGVAPMWIAMGEERLSDGAKIIAQTAATQGVVVHWEEYKGMPHNWPMIFPSWWQSRRCMEHWAQACLSFAHGRDASSSAETISVDGQVTKGDVTNLTGLGLQEASKRMRAKQASFKPWTGDKATRGKL